MKISIIGGGPVGALLSIILSKNKLPVEVYEMRGDMRYEEVGGGKSINLALSERGIKALSLAGIRDEISKMAIPMYGRMIHHPDQTTDFQPYGIEGQAINSISRSGLNALIIDKAEKNHGVKFHFHFKCKGIDFKSGQAVMQSPEGNMLQTGADLIFGADGAFSAIRYSLLKTSRFNYCQEYLDHGYKELTIPPATNGKHRIEKNALHIWPRKKFMLIALPNLDGSFTVTLFLPFEGENSFNHLQTPRDVRAFFKKHFPDALIHMPDLEEEFFNNPIGTLVTIKCYPWVYRNQFALVGDAAHAIVPFYGQGMNAGFEDCTILHDLIQHFNGDWQNILSNYQKKRKPDADAIAELAMMNFIEMRDKVADREFLRRKQLEKIIHLKYPERFIPVYTMVTFSHLPYRKALEAQQLQDLFFKNLLLEFPDIESKIDDKATWQRIEQLMTEIGL